MSESIFSFCVAFVSWGKAVSSGVSLSGGGVDVSAGVLDSAGGGTSAALFVTDIVLVHPQRVMEKQIVHNKSVIRYLANIIKLPPKHNAS